MVILYDPQCDINDFLKDPEFVKNIRDHLTLSWISFKLDQEIFYKKMRNIYEHYWNWIDKRNVAEHKNHVENICTTIWCDIMKKDVNELSNMFVNYKAIDRKRSCCYALLLNKDHFSESTCVLFVRHDEKSNWTLPGGKYEQNENIYECLGRELYEEANLSSLRNTTYLGHFYEYKLDKRMIDCLCLHIHEAEDLKSNTKEISDVAWFRLDNLPPNTSKLFKFVCDKFNIDLTKFTNQGL